MNSIIKLINNQLSITEKSKNKKEKKCKSNKYEKLELSIQKIKKDNTIESNYFLKKNKFSTFIKDYNFINLQYIYTKFPQSIELVSEYDQNSVEIKAIVVDRLGRLYIAGSFNKIGDLVCNNIAMWDGNKWNRLGDGINSQIISLVVDSKNNLFVGGSFSGSGNQNLISSSSIIKWNGRKWESLDGGVNGNVNVISTLSNGLIVIGGSFTSSITSGTPLQKIAMWNGLNWINLGTDFLNNGNIYGLDIDSKNNIYVGGFNLPVSVLNMADNIWTILTDSNSNILDQIVNTVVINQQTGNPVFGGSFGNFGTVTGVFNAIEFNLSTNTWVSLNNPDGFGLDAQCFKLFYDKTNKRIIAGGIFDRLTNGTEDNTVLNKVAVWDGTYWRPLGSGINGNYVESFGILPDNTLFIGGNILGTNNIWSNGLVIYTNNYVNIWRKDKLIYTLTNFEKSITISNNCDSQYIFQKKM